MVPSSPANLQEAQMTYKYVDVDHAAGGRRCRKGQTDRSDKQDCSNRSYRDAPHIIYVALLVLSLPQIYVTKSNCA